MFAASYSMKNTRHLVLILFFTTACTGVSKEILTSPYAKGRMMDKPQQCVPYAREISGIKIYGDAHSWFDKASPSYSKGTKPKKNAVIVLKSTPKMPHGHLAVVKNLVDERHIDVAHSNWGSDRKSRSIIYDSMRVEDVSRGNDWSSVKFWNPEINSFGFPYAVRGFIYRD